MDNHSASPITRVCQRGSVHHAKVGRGSLGWYLGTREREVRSKESGSEVPSERSSSNFCVMHRPALTYSLPLPCNKHPFHRKASGENSIERVLMHGRCIRLGLWPNDPCPHSPRRIQRPCMRTLSMLFSPDAFRWNGCGKRQEKIASRGFSCTGVVSASDCAGKDRWASREDFQVTSGSSARGS
jgi:hypothetical protein